MSLLADQGLWAIFVPALIIAFAARYFAQSVLVQAAPLLIGAVVAVCAWAGLFGAQAALGVTDSARSFVIALVLAVIVLGYRFGLKALKSRAAAPVVNRAAPADPSALTGPEIDRYARHLVLRELGGAGQQKLRKTSVLVIGAGGLGSPALMYLAAAGFGRIGIVDDDHVSLSNLQRQVLHSTDAIGRLKTETAAERLAQINPHPQIETFAERVDHVRAVELISNFDLVLDGCDNAETRYAVNAACVGAGVPLVSGAISQWEGQVSVFDPATSGPCYSCVFPNEAAAGSAPSCAVAGVVGALPGIVGSMMALEAIKVATGAGQALRGRMMVYDGLWGESRMIGLSRNDACPICFQAEKN